jgi:hypothetical protein
MHNEVGWVKLVAQLLYVRQLRQKNLNDAVGCATACLLGEQMITNTR